MCSLACLLVGSAMAFMALTVLCARTHRGGTYNNVTCKQSYKFMSLLSMAVPIVNLSVITFDLLRAEYISTVALTVARGLHTTHCLVYY